MARKNKPSNHYTRARRPDKPKATNHLHKLGVKKNDIVEIISGADRGKRAKVLRTVPSEGCVVVEGVNKKWKHLNRTQENPQGGRIEREYPIPVSKVRKVES